jgi:mannose-6-phosphate isomerase-like protein (cupin superfamily)
MNRAIKEYYFKEGCYIEEWQNDEQQPDMSIARVRVSPNVTTSLHKLKATAERYLILEGRAKVTVGDDSWEVAEKDVVSIGANVAQRIQNLGDQDLLFLAICTPRFTEHNYIDLEDK